jgi:hypothetical protein
VVGRGRIGIGLLERVRHAYAFNRLLLAIDVLRRFDTPLFVITTGGVDVVFRTKFKEWAAVFIAKINDLQFEVIETFQNEDESRVASRWRIVGKNNGILGTPADQQPISFTGTAVWAVREDGKLCGRVGQVVEK